MKKAIKVIAFILAAAVLWGAASVTAFAQIEDNEPVYYPDNYPWLTLGEVSKPATAAIYLRVGESETITIQNLECGIQDIGGNTLAQYWLGERTDENLINVFTLWRVTDSSVVDFTDEYKAAHPSEYDTLPMLEQDSRYLERYDMYTGFIPYLGYNFTKSDTDESGYDYDDAVNGNWGQRRAEIVAKKSGITTVEVAKGGYGICCPARGTLIVVCYEGSVFTGDFNKDGYVTVSDALTAVRIAAEFVGATPESLATGDLDCDGSITVNDALAILRTAAGLAEL